MFIEFLLSCILWFFGVIFGYALKTDNTDIITPFVCVSISLLLVAAILVN